MNSQEDQDARRYRRQRSRESTVPSSNLQSILEEDKRKSVIQSLGERPPSDRLQIYIRRGSDNSPQSESTVTSPKTSTTVASEENKQSIYIRQTNGSDYSKTKASPAAEKQSIYIRPNDKTPSTISSINSSCTSTSDSQLPESIHSVAPPPRRTRRTHHIYDEQTNNKIEIDSDNIETPPSIRKSFNREHQNVSGNSSCRKLHGSTDQANESELKKVIGGLTEPEVLGDGQFDRFSSARRTRRFKRPVDLSSGNETTSPESLPDNPLVLETVRPVVAAVAEIESNEKQKELRLKRWQDKLNSSSAVEDKGKISEPKTLKTSRNMSRISQEDVRQAIRSLKSPSPERSWSPPKEIVREAPSSVKVITHELNDEGFEETQSLVSDTPSHGKDSTSSCNDYGSDSKNKKIVKPSVSVADRSPRKIPIRTPPSLPSLLITKPQSALERSKSLRGTPPALVNKNLLPRRTNSMRRTESPLLNVNAAKQQQQLDVERSNSRTSLRSSRSSLSSAVSINTVKKVPLRPKSSPLTNSSGLSGSGPVSTTLSAHSSPTKRPLSAGSVRTPLSGTPASRSSSSGSSIGQGATTGVAARKPPLKSVGSSSLGPSTSFKENQNQNTVRNRLQSKTPSNTSIANSGGSVSSGSTTRIGTARSGTISTSRTGGFMRPTTSSATKVKGSKA